MRGGPVAQRWPRLALLWFRAREAGPGYGVGMSAAATPEPRYGRKGRSFADASAAEVRAALIPEEAAEFEREWRAALADAAETLDLTEVFATLESWRTVAELTAAAGAEAHRAMYRRAARRLTGDDIPADEPLRQTKARLGL